MPVHILPGVSDPAGVILPQQPFPPAMFGDAARYSTFSCETNPTYLSLSTEAGPSDPIKPPIKRTLLVNSGQPLNDMFKYLPTPPNTRLSMLENTLKWRHMAPTAPDTLWCHPFRDDDPFIIRQTPDICIVGGQKKFGTRLVTGQEGMSKEGNPQRCRIVLVPSFALTGILVLVNLRNLDVKRIDFMVQGMRGGGETEMNSKLVYFWSSHEVLTRNRWISARTQSYTS
jgi:DNA polymerase delta subunit 2